MHPPVHTQKYSSSAAAAPPSTAQGFSWRDLPPVDTSSEALARRSLLEAAVKRFLTLRAEVRPAASLLPRWPSAPASRPAVSQGRGARQLQPCMAPLVLLLFDAVAFSGCNLTPASPASPLALLCCAALPLPRSSSRRICRSTASARSTCATATGGCWRRCPQVGGPASAALHLDASALEGNAPASPSDPSMCPPPPPCLI